MTADTLLPINTDVWRELMMFLSLSSIWSRFAIMVPDPRLDSSYHGVADQVLGSLLDFNPSDWDLPPFED